MQKNKDKNELSIHKEMLKRAQIGFEKAKRESNDLLMFAHSKVAMKATSEIKRLNSQ